MKQINTLMQAIDGGNVERIEICAICKGSGYFEFLTCEFCQGSGEFNQGAYALWKYHRCRCGDGVCGICITRCHCKGVN